MIGYVVMIFGFWDFFNGIGPRNGEKWGEGGLFSLGIVDV